MQLLGAKRQVRIDREARHNLRNLTPPDPERQKRQDEVMSEVWQLAGDEASLTKFVKAKRLGGFG